MEARAHIKNVRISPIKLRTVLDSIKTMKPQTALDYLGLSKKRTSKVLYKAIKSAVDNGKTSFNLDPKKAKFKILSVDEGVFLKRFRAGSRGMGKPYKRRASHILVILEEKGAQKKKLPAKKSKKSTDKKVTKPVKEVKNSKRAEAPKEAKQAKK